MLTEAAAPQALTLLPELDDELLLTRRMLARAPEDYYHWQPHPRSTSLGQLVAHISGLLAGIGNAFRTTDVDLAGYVAPPVPQTSAELLRRLDAAGQAARAALSEAAPEDYEATWTLRHGPHVIVSQPRAAVVRHLLSHLIHHRGQLSVYLRLLEVPVPSIYGPSADEPGR